VYQTILKPQILCIALRGDTFCNVVRATWKEVITHLVNELSTFEQPKSLSPSSPYPETVESSQCKGLHSTYVASILAITHACRPTSSCCNQSLHPYVMRPKFCLYVHLTRVRYVSHSTLPPFFIIIIRATVTIRSRDSVVGIATGYGLDDREVEFESR
jgi:hypothetical protein